MPPTAHQGSPRSAPLSFGPRPLFTWSAQVALREPWSAAKAGLPRESGSSGSQVGSASLLVEESSWQRAEACPPQGLLPQTLLLNSRRLSLHRHRASYRLRTSLLLPRAKLPTLLLTKAKLSSVPPYCLSSSESSPALDQFPRSCCSSSFRLHVSLGSGDHRAQFSFPELLPEH